MFQERGDNNERCESCQSFGSSNLLRLTTGQKIATLPDIVKEQFGDFDGIISGLSTDPDLDSNIPEQCRECPQLAELAIGDAAFNQLLPGIEQQTVGCPGIIKCMSPDEKTVAEVCGSPTMLDRGGHEAAIVRRTGGDEQDLSE